MSTEYIYSISGDFPNSKVDSTRLVGEIKESNITIALDYINTSDDDCNIWFETTLSGSEETTLSGVVAAHDGEHRASVISIYIVTAGENVGARKVVYISGSDEAKLACADSENTLPAVGLTEYGVSAGNNVTVRTNDILGGFSGLTPGAEYFLSTTTSGELTTIKPTSGIIVRMGVAKSSTDLDVHILRLYSEASGSIFGSEYQVVESNGLSSITGTIALQQKLRLNVTDLPLGKYRFSWNFDWLYSNTNNSFQARIEMDDYFRFIYMMTQEPQDSDNEYNESGFNILTGFSGTHYFDLDYGTLNASHTAKILNAIMEIWRIG